jgi:predicted acylesterase/phospholipase RssA
MGITIVEKGDRSRVRAHAKTGLVLAGGAISGGAFKVGGLIALNTYLGNRSVVDFDIYLGLSAGAFLAAPLAAGIAPEELLKSIDGTSRKISHFSPLDFYLPNYREFLSRPLRAPWDALSVTPAFWQSVAHLLRDKRGELVHRGRVFLRDPGIRNAEALVTPIIEDMMLRTGIGSGRSYLPSGLCDNRRIEAFIRDNLKRNGLANDFRLLHMERGNSLYIAATNLDTGEGVLFGHDADTSATISEAVQASTAIPGFYRPPKIRGQHYLDGGVRRTAHISQATDRGAQLLFVYNPFRPFVNYHTDQLLNNKASLADMGIGTVINQAFRTLLHTRLMLGIEKLQLNPDFHGDVIVLEPAETDVKFFQTNPLNFWQRADSALHGYVSATEALERHHERIQAILASYGIQTDIGRLRERIERIRRGDYDSRTIMKELQREVHVAPQAQRHTAPGLKVVRG